MKLINFRTIGCLLITTLAYISYYFYGLNQKIANPIKQSEFSSFWLQNNPLLWLYIFSIGLILVVGIISQARRNKLEAQLNQQKRKKQRKSYSL